MARHREVLTTQPSIIAAARTAAASGLPGIIDISQLLPNVQVSATDITTVAGGGSGGLVHADLATTTTPSGTAVIQNATIFTSSVAGSNVPLVFCYIFGITTGTVL